MLVWQVPSLPVSFLCDSSELLLLFVRLRTAGVALCYGNNNGRACAVGSVPSLAPNVADRAHPGFLAAQPSFPIKLPFCSLPPRLCPGFRLAFFPHFVISPALPLSKPTGCLSLSLSSQFHPFFCTTKTVFHQCHLKTNKTCPENANLNRNATAVGIFV